MAYRRLDASGGDPAGAPLIDDDTDNRPGRHADHGTEPPVIEQHLAEDLSICGTEDDADTDP
jgi:hypothetical protein